MVHSGYQRLNWRSGETAEGNRKQTALVICLWGTKPFLSTLLGARKDKDFGFST
ncbi:unnamed protein product, partial [Nesidiocoris tenuis]